MMLMGRSCDRAGDSAIERSLAFHDPSNYWINRRQSSSNNTHTWPSDKTYTMEGWTSRLKSYLGHQPIQIFLTIASNFVISCPTWHAASLRFLSDLLNRGTSFGPKSSMLPRKNSSNAGLIAFVTRWLHRDSHRTPNMIFNHLFLSTVNMFVVFIRRPSIFLSTILILMVKVGKRIFQHNTQIRHLLHRCCPISILRHFDMHSATR